MRFTQPDRLTFGAEDTILHLSVGREDLAHDGDLPKLRCASRAPGAKATDYEQERSRSWRDLDEALATGEREGTAGGAGSREGNGEIATRAQPVFCDARADRQDKEHQRSG